MIGRVMERSPWIVAALLVWLWAPLLSRAASNVWPADHVVGRGAALDVVGRAMVGVPLLWLLATWLVWAAKMTLVGSWSSEGRVGGRNHAAGLEASRERLIRQALGPEAWSLRPSA
jgi:hypothetical protein